MTSDFSDTRTLIHQMRKAGKKYFTSIMHFEDVNESYYRLD